jgi:hypothetical protein
MDMPLNRPVRYRDADVARPAIRPGDRAADIMVEA